MLASVLNVLSPTKVTPGHPVLGLGMREAHIPGMGQQKRAGQSLPDEQTASRYLHPVLQGKSKALVTD